MDEIRSASRRRLGSDALRTLIIDATTRQLFQSRDQRISDFAKGLWDHSVAVGLLARDIAALVGGAHPEAANLAGLIHGPSHPPSVSSASDNRGPLAHPSPSRW